MPLHDIIDNRHEKLVDQIQAILPNVNMAKFAVGYFFLSGLEAIGSQINHITELRLLIGNTSNRQTIEQLTEGYRRLELAEEALDSIRFAKRAERRQWAQETAENLRQTVELMDQTDEGQELVHGLVQMIEEKRLKVRVYTQGRLHAKAYIFDFINTNPGNEGIAIVGSSNLTLSGLVSNTELNVIVHDKGSAMQPGQGNHARLTKWFNELWEEGEDFDAALMEELQKSWAARLATPYDIYMKTLHSLVRDRIDGGDEQEILWDDEITRTLTDFQKDAVKQAVQMIRDNGGCFVSDVVGLGKSYIGAGIVKHFERTEQARSLIICPKPLEDMWIGYNEKYHLNAHILPMSQLQSGERGADLLNDIRYRDRNFVLIDESHNFRRQQSQRYKELQTFLSTGGGRKVCLLTATPRNNQAMDVYNQIKLFHLEDITDLPIDPPDLRQYFKLIENGERRLQDVLRSILIRRTRRHILHWYGLAEDTDQPLRELSGEELTNYLDGESRAYIRVGDMKRFFPRRNLETVRYSIEATYSGLYDTLRGYLGSADSSRAELMSDQTLYYARYGLWHYLKPEKQNVRPYTDLKRAGINLRGLLRTMLFKRFESSVYAFRETLTRMITTHTMFLKSLEKGFVPAGEKAEQLLGRGNLLEEDELLDTLGEISKRYKLEDFQADLLIQHVESDLNLLNTMLGMVSNITPDKDDKLVTLLSILEQEPLVGQKILVFTQYSDTAQYLFQNLNPDKAHSHIDVIFGNDKSKSRIVGRFAPNANPEFAVASDQELQLLVATDVLAEGLNMQDGNIVLNYDLHWNPVRLIQRFGRIDRIGSEHDEIWGVNFLPELELERNLGLHEVLNRRIQEIHDTIGEDAAILDESERLNEEAMYAIYEAQSGQALAAAEGEEDFIDLNEAEQLFRSMAQNDPDEYERIVNLRDGIRSGKPSEVGNLYVFCQAGRFQQLFLVDESGEIMTRDVSQILQVIQASKELPPPSQLPDGYNDAVMAIKKRFSQEVKRRQAKQRHSQALSPAQRYVIRELRVARMQTSDEDQHSQYDELERAFSKTPTVAVRKELNFLRRNGIIDEPLIVKLTQIYHEHRLRERADQLSMQERTAVIPKIICSEALI